MPTYKVSEIPDFAALSPQVLTNSGSQQDILTGDTIMSGSHKIEEVWGLVYEVKGAWAHDSAHKCLLLRPLGCREGEDR
jgi:hypothetical protein